MNPIAHTAIGSFVAYSGDFNLRERRLIMLSALATDLDGVPGGAYRAYAGLRFAATGAPLDNQLLTSLDAIHHTFSHNIFFALLMGVLIAAVNRGRRRALFAAGSIASLLQVVADNLTNHPSWPIMYFWPVWDKDFGLGNFISWPGLDFFIMVVVQYFFLALVLVGIVVFYLRTGHTFLELVSSRFDRLLTDFIRLAFTEKCSVCRARAFYRDSDTGLPLCGHHVHISRGLVITRRTEKKSRPEPDPDD